MKIYRELLSSSTIIYETWLSYVSFLFLFIQFYKASLDANFLRRLFFVLNRLKIRVVAQTQFEASIFASCPGLEKIDKVEYVNHSDKLSRKRGHVTTDDERSGRSSQN